MYSYLTKNNIIISIPFADTKQSYWYIRHRRYSCGCQIKTSGNIYSLTSGVVIELTKDYLTIQYNQSICMRYIGLSSLMVSYNQQIPRGYLIGKSTDKIGVELLTVDNTSNIVWSVRIGETTFYKSDPTPYLTGEDVLDESGIDNVDVHHIDGDNDMNIQIPNEFQGNLNPEINRWLTATPI